MSDEDLPPVVYWPEVMRPALEVASLIEANWPGYTEMLKSRALFNAAYNDRATTLPEIRERVNRIVWCLTWINNAQRNGPPDAQHNGPPDVSALAESIERTRKEREANLKRIVSIAWETPAPYQQRLFLTAREMSEDMPLPPLRGKRGRAAASNAGAWNGWCIRELNEVLSPEAINRNATITELLGFVGIKTTRQLVGSVLEAGKSRKPK